MTFDWNTLPVKLAQDREELVQDLISEPTYDKFLTVRARIQEIDRILAIPNEMERSAKMREQTHG